MVYITLYYLVVSPKNKNMWGCVSVICVGDFVCVCFQPSKTRYAVMMNNPRKEVSEVPLLDVLVCFVDTSPVSKKKEVSKVGVVLLCTLVPHPCKKLEHKEYIQRNLICLCRMCVHDLSALNR